MTKIGQNGAQHKYSHIWETCLISLAQSVSASSTLFAALVVYFILSSSTFGSVIGVTFTSKSATFLQSFSAISPTQNTLVSINMSCIIPSSVKLSQASVTIASNWCMFSSQELTLFYVSLIVLFILRIVLFNSLTCMTNSPSSTFIFSNMAF